MDRQKVSDNLKALESKTDSLLERLTRSGCSFWIITGFALLFFAVVLWVAWG